MVAFMTQFHTGTLILHKANAKTTFNALKSNYFKKVHKYENIIYVNLCKWVVTVN
jgi:hypothetical protein